MPNLELGHHPFRDGKTYEDYWSARGAREGRQEALAASACAPALEQLEPIFNSATLYLGGGNARHLRPQDLPTNVRICSNEAGLLGGIALWR